MPFSQNNQLRLLLDENIPRKVVELLAKEEGLEQRILVTFDKHFRNTLLYPPKEYFGIVFIKVRPPLIKTALSALLSLFKSVDPSEFKGKLFILSPIGFRLFPKEPRF